MSDDKMEEYKKYMKDPLDINSSDFEENEKSNAEIELSNDDLNDFKEDDKNQEKKEFNSSNEIVEESKDEKEEQFANRKEAKMKMSEIFIGKNYKKIATKKFSFPGFFFGGMYFLYRKMYLEGIILFIMTYLLSIVCPLFLLLNNYQSLVFIPYLLLFILNITIGFSTNKIYKNFVIKKMMKIKNLHLSYDESAKKCKKSGGTSFKNMLVINIIISTLLGYSVQKLFINQLNDFIKNDSIDNTNFDSSEVTNNIDENDSSDDYIELEMNFNFDPTEIFDFEISNEFLKFSQTTYDYMKSTSNPGIYEYAAIKFGINEVYNSPKLFLSKYTNNFTKEVINGNEWYIYETIIHSPADEYNEAFDYKVKYYVIAHEEIIYIIKTEIADNGFSSNAEQYVDQFISSLKVK